MALWLHGDRCGTVWDRRPFFTSDKNEYIALRVCSCRVPLLRLARSSLKGALIGISSVKAFVPSAKPKDTSIGHALAPRASVGVPLPCLSGRIPKVMKATCGAWHPERKCNGESGLEGGHGGRVAGFDTDREATCCE